MQTETTVKKIEEVIDLLEMFSTKRKPLITRKLINVNPYKTNPLPEVEVNFIQKDINERNKLG